MEWVLQLIPPVFSLPILAGMTLGMNFMGVEVSAILSLVFPLG